jgi:hypothetical protein
MATICGAHLWKIRRATLTGLLRKAGPGVRLSEHLDGDGATIFRHVCALGGEGIVAKRRAARSGSPASPHSHLHRRGSRRHQPADHNE